VPFSRTARDLNDAKPVAQVPMQPEPLIDGAKEPDRIPDEIACLLLFRILADRPNGPAYEIRAAHLEAGKFSSRETQEIIDAANRTVLEIKEMESEIAAAGISMDAKAQLAGSRRETILQTAITKLTKRLGPDGSKRWETYLNNNVKPGVITTSTP
jgi:hypothetical protein